MLRSILDFLEGLGHIVLAFFEATTGLLVFIGRAIWGVFCVLCTVLILAFIWNVVQNSGQSAEPSLSEYTPNRGEATHGPAPVSVQIQLAPISKKGAAAYERGDYKTAHREFLKAAKLGHANAQFILGEMYANGEGVPKDDVEAMRWYRKAAEQGYVTAQFYLGLMYASGEGVPRDRIEAYMWVNLAAVQGQEMAAWIRDRLQLEMTKSEIALAQARAREWWPSSGSGAPSGGATRRSIPPRETASWARTALPDSTGSGFFVSSAGHILTNNHVIAGCARLRVSPHGGGAVVQARNWGNDLALLQVGAGRGARPVVLRNGRARLGETAVAAGYPLRGLVGDGLNVTRGEVSALSGLGGDSRRLQITAPVQPGNSGGPLLDKSGHVLGVVTSKLNAIRAARITGDIPQNVNFAIRAEVARTFLDAHNVPYKTARSTTTRSTEQIAAEARSYTVLIECWE